MAKKAKTEKTEKTFAINLTLSELERLDAILRPVALLGGAAGGDLEFEDFMFALQSKVEVGMDTLDP